jgi:hypothetical protein
VLPLRASRSPGCSLWRAPVTTVTRTCHHRNAHLSPPLRAPVTTVTRTCMCSDSPGLHHFPDDLPYICHSLWFLPQALLFQFHVCIVRVSCFVLCCVYLLKHSLNLLLDSQRTSLQLQNNAENQIKFICHVRRIQALTNSAKKVLGEQ